MVCRGLGRRIPDQEDTGEGAYTGGGEDGEGGHEGGVDGTPLASPPKWMISPITIVPWRARFRAARAAGAGRCRAADALCAARGRKGAVAWVSLMDVDDDVSQSARLSTVHYRRSILDVGQDQCARCAPNSAKPWTRSRAQSGLWLAGVVVLALRRQPPGQLVEQILLIVSDPRHVAVRPYQQRARLVPRGRRRRSRPDPP
jgi:hypothetical protein